MNDEWELASTVGAFPAPLRPSEGQTGTWTFPSPFEGAEGLRTAEVHGWVPGRPGKGAMMPNGEIRTWKNYFTHDEMAPGHLHAFQIEPTGATTVYTTDQHAANDVIRRVQAIHPEVTLADQFGPPSYDDPFAFHAVRKDLTPYPPEGFDFTVARTAMMFTVQDLYLMMADALDRARQAINDGDMGEHARWAGEYHRMADEIKRQTGQDPRPPDDLPALVDNPERWSSVWPNPDQLPLGWPPKVGDHVTHELIGQSGTLVALDLPNDRALMRWDRDGRETEVKGLRRLHVASEDQRQHHDGQHGVEAENDAEDNSHAPQSRRAAERPQVPSQRTARQRWLSDQEWLTAKTPPGFTPYAQGDGGGKALMHDNGQWYTWATDEGDGPDHGKGEEAMGLDWDAGRHWSYRPPGDGVPGEAFDFTASRSAWQVWCENSPEEEIEPFGDYLAYHNEADRDSGELDDVPDEQVERWYENWVSEGRPRTSRALRGYAARQSTPKARHKPGDPQKCKRCDNPATKSLIWAEGAAYVAVCDKHEAPMRAHLGPGEVNKVITITAATLPEQQQRITELEAALEQARGNPQVFWGIYEQLQALKGDSPDLRLMHPGEKPEGYEQRGTIPQQDLRPSPVDEYKRRLLGVAPQWTVQEARVTPEQSYLNDTSWAWTHRPWIADTQTRTITLGQQGTHHNDLYHEVGRIPDPNVTNDKYDGWGTVRNGIIGVGEGTREMAEALRNHLGGDHVVDTAGTVSDSEWGHGWDFTAALDEPVKYYRGLYLGQNVDPDDDQAILGRLRTREGQGFPPELMPTYPLYGQHWTADPEVARKFALDPKATYVDRGSLLQRRRNAPHYGIVIEAHGQVAHRPDLVNGDFSNEQQVTFPHRDDISNVRLHLHRLDPDQRSLLPKYPTYVRSIEVPEAHWRKASWGEPPIKRAVAATPLRLNVWDNEYDHAELAANWIKLDRHSGTVCGCIKRCVYDGGTGHGHRAAVAAGEKPKHEALTWDTDKEQHTASPHTQHGFPTPDAISTLTPNLPSQPATPQVDTFHGVERLAPPTVGPSTPEGDSGTYARELATYLQAHTGHENTPLAVIDNQAEGFSARHYLTREEALQAYEQAGSPDVRDDWQWQEQHETMQPTVPRKWLAHSAERYSQGESEPNAGRTQTAGLSDWLFPHPLAPEPQVQTHCYFHPEADAVAWEGGAAMCHYCLERYQAAQRAVGERGERVRTQAGLPGQDKALASTYRPSLQGGLPYTKKAEAFDFADNGVQGLYQYSGLGLRDGTAGTGPGGTPIVNWHGMTQADWNGRHSMWYSPSEDRLDIGASRYHHAQIPHANDAVPIWHAGGLAPVMPSNYYHKHPEEDVLPRVQKILTDQGIPVAVAGSEGFDFTANGDPGVSGGNGWNFGKISAMDRSWHLTDKHDFALDPEHAPTDNAFALQDRSGRKGLYLGEPEHWYNGQNYKRPYVAEIEHPPAQEERWGGERFLAADQFPQSRVLRVIPYYQYEKETFGGGNEDLAAEGDVRQWTPEQDAAYKERLNQYIMTAHPEMLREVCPRCANNYVAPGKPCPKCGYATDWDGRIYSKKGSQGVPGQAGPGWHVQESDFDPRNTYFDEGDPDRSDLRVVVAHKPTGSIYVGQPGTHHADLIDHHQLSDSEEFSPYEWTSDQQGDYPDLHYGSISDRGGYSSYGPKPPGITEALHAHGLLQQPDGSVHTNLDNPDAFDFTARVATDYGHVILHEPEGGLPPLGNTGWRYPFMWTHSADGVHTYLGPDGSEHWQLDSPASFRPSIYGDMEDPEMHPGLSDRLRSGDEIFGGYGAIKNQDQNHDTPPSTRMEVFRHETNPYRSLSQAFAHRGWLRPENVWPSDEEPLPPAEDEDPEGFDFTAAWGRPSGEVALQMVQTPKSDYRGGARPIIANPADNAIYIGGAGAQHGDVYDRMPNGWGDGHARGLWHPDKGSYQWFDKSPGPEYDARLEAVGLKPHVEPEAYAFQFARTAVLTQDGWQILDAPLKPGWTPEHLDTTGYFANRQPFLIDHDNQAIHLGPKGAYHYMLQAPVEPGYQTEAWVTHPSKANGMTEPAVSGYDGEDNKPIYDSLAKHFRTELATKMPGEEAFDFTASWDDDFWESPFPEDMNPWNPGQLGKGLVSPEGRAYTWQVDEDHGTDGYPSHEQALQAIGGPKFVHAMKDGWSFHTIYHDGRHNRMVGPSEHDAIMKAHLPQEPRCAGCGAIVQPDAEGDYTCLKCRWRGGYGPSDEDEAFDFTAAYDPSDEFSVLKDMPPGTMPWMLGDRARLLMGPEPHQIAHWTMDYDDPDLEKDIGGRDDPYDDPDWHHSDMTAYLYNRGHQWVEAGDAGMVHPDGTVEMYSNNLDPSTVKRNAEAEGFKFGPAPAPQGFDFRTFLPTSRGHMSGYRERRNGPWQPGGWGKGLGFADGTVYTWPVSSRSATGANGLHHLGYARDVLGMPEEDFFDHIHNRTLQLYQIDPWGRVKETLSGDRPYPHVYQNGLKPSTNPQTGKGEWGNAESQAADDAFRF